MEYTEESFKKVLTEYRRMVKENEEMNGYDYGYYRAMVDFENLILFGVSQQREQLLQAYKDGFQAATDSIVGANEMIKNKTLQ